MYDIITQIGTIYLRNPPVDANKIISIRENMAANGWCGMPVILADSGDCKLAFTGSHRLAAAAFIDDLDIVAIYLPFDLSDDDWAEINSASDDDDILSVFETIAENRDDMDQIVEVMRAEV